MVSNRVFGRGRVQRDGIMDLGDGELRPQREARRRQQRGGGGGGGAKLTQKGDLTWPGGVVPANTELGAAQTKQTRRYRNVAGDGPGQSFRRCSGLLLVLTEAVSRGSLSQDP